MREAIRTRQTPLLALAVVSLGFLGISDLWARGGRNVVEITCPPPHKTKIYLTTPDSATSIQHADGTWIAYDGTGDEASALCDLNAGVGGCLSKEGDASCSTESVGADGEVTVNCGGSNWVINDGNGGTCQINYDSGEHMMATGGSCDDMMGNSASVDCSNNGGMGGCTTSSGMGSCTAK